jgi:hypothetical protein
MAGGNNGNGSNGESARIGTSKVKQGLAQMLKGGVIVSLFGRSFSSFFFQFPTSVSFPHRSSWPDNLSLPYRASPSPIEISRRWT